MNNNIMYEEKNEKRKRKTNFFKEKAKTSVIVFMQKEMWHHQFNFSTSFLGNSKFCLTVRVLKRV